MKANRLLRLFPPAWRSRYGDEFLATAGDTRLRTQQIVDIIFAAADAWLSAEVRNAARVIGSAPTGGGTMTVRTLVCGGASARYTVRESLIAAAIVIGLTAIFALAANTAKQEGWPVSAEILQNLALFGPIVMSAPLWLTRRQPWKAQVLFVGGMLAFLVVIGWLGVQL